MARKFFAAKMRNSRGRVMKFIKMQGLKNDYVFIDCFKEKVLNPESLAVKISDRRSGVGGDGLILITPSKLADAGVRIYNADGSVAEMCGNGVRCAAKYLYDEKIVSKNRFKIETAGGIKEVSVYPVNGAVKTVAVDMGAPDFSPEKVSLNSPESVIMRPFLFKGKKLYLTALSVGNPHAAVLTDGPQNTDLFAVKDFITSSDLFLSEVNFEFYEILNDREIDMRVIERGSGETYACGTGATAVSVAAGLIGGVDLKKGVTVNMKGGAVTVKKRGENYILTGGAEYCFKGEYNG